MTWDTFCLHEKLHKGIHFYLLDIYAFRKLMVVQWKEVEVEVEVGYDGLRQAKACF